MNLMLARSHRRPRPSRLTRLGLLGLGTLLGLLALEGILQAYTALVLLPRANRPVPDAVIGHRPNPAFRGHDARGWRNASALRRAEIVVMGDSQTYGLNASVRATWPQQLSAILKRSVYQMAYLEYGPAQFVLLVDEALALRPTVILVAYYFGNDIFDMYAAAYNRGSWRRMKSSPRLDALVSTDPRVLKALADADAAQQRPALRCITRVFRSRRLGSTMAQYSRLVRAGQVLTQRVVARSPWRRSRSADYDPVRCPQFRDGDLATVFTPQYRFVAVNDRDPRIIEAERLTFLAFKYLADRSRGAGGRFYVVMIPTKETAFRSRVEATLRDHAGLVELWNAEARARARAVTFLARERIPVIDTLPALAEMITTGINPYMEGTDGHPRPSGYKAIARAVASRLVADGLEDRP